MEGNRCGSRRRAGDQRADGQRALANGKDNTEEPEAEMRSEKCCSLTNWGARRKMGKVERGGDFEGRLILRENEGEAETAHDSLRDPTTEVRNRRAASSV
jgi:hypothetical protein